jgi:hypothetical protein
MDATRTPKAAVGGGQRPESSRWRLGFSNAGRPGCPGTTGSALDRAGSGETYQGVAVAERSPAVRPQRVAGLQWPPAYRLDGWRASGFGVGSAIRVSVLRSVWWNGSVWPAICNTVSSS